MRSPAFWVPTGLVAISSGILNIATDGRKPVWRVPDSYAHRFLGDVATMATPVGRDIVDLNLMLRRNFDQSEVIAMLDGRIDTLSPTSVTTVRRTSILECADQTFKLNDRKPVIFDEPSEKTVCFNQPSLVISLAPQPTNAEAARLA